MQGDKALGRSLALVRELRARCPWDGAQTPETLRPYLVEEALELDQAIRDADRQALPRELGDLLLHLAFQIVIGQERGWFDAETVTRALEEKMRRRHPHLFGGGAAPASWEMAKRTETAGPRSALDGVPRALPALVAAFRLQERAAGVGFDWPDARGPREKIAEELAELDRETAAAAPARDAVEDEVGDLLFSVVNYARKLGVDPRAALERANDKFTARFRLLERLAGERGIELGRAPLDALDALWTEAKRA